MAYGSSADTARKPVAHSPHRFEEGMAYIKKWGYPVDENLTVPFED
jgi:hypothetical protein